MNSLDVAIQTVDTLAFDTGTEHTGDVLETASAILSECECQCRRVLLDHTREHWGAAIERVNLNRDMTLGAIGVIRMFG